MKEFMKKYGKWLILAALVFVFAFITREVLQKELTGFDTAVYNFISKFENPLLTEIFKFLSFLSSGTFIVLLSIALFFIFKSKKYGLLSLCNLVFIVILNQTLKLFFSRPRPFEWMLIEETGYSFPSGHAMVSAAFYGMLIYLIWQTKLKTKYKKIWTIVLALLIFFIGLSRIYLGVHYTSDILAGFTLSLSCLIVTTSVVSYYLKCQRSVKNGKN